MVAATDDAGLEAAKATANTAGALQGELTYSDVGAVTVGKDGYKWGQGSAVIIS